MAAQVFRRTRHTGLYHYLGGLRKLRFFRLTTLAKVAIILSAHCMFAEDLKLRLVDQSDVETRLRAGVVPAGEREDLIAKLFREAGCEVSRQKVNKRSSNVICRLRGETPATIVVGGHFDFAEQGKGIVDDWSGTSLLPSLFEALKSAHRTHTFEFVAFTAEETGLAGSARFVKELTAEEKTNLQAFVNLECLGLNPPKVWFSRSTPLLVRLLAGVAAAIHIPLQGVNVEKVGDDDTHAFLDKKIRVISIHSITQETWGILHSARDNLDVINSTDYYNAYRLVAFYLAFLDFKLPT